MGAIHLPAAWFDGGERREARSERQIRLDVGPVQMDSMHDPRPRKAPRCRACLMHA
jgi:hypothetical protein